MSCFETLNFEVKPSKKKRLRFLVVELDEAAFNGEGGQRPRKFDEAVRILTADGRTSAPLNLTMDETEGGVISAEKMQDLRAALSDAPITVVFSRVADSVLECLQLPRLESAAVLGTSGKRLLAAEKQPGFAALDGAGLGWLHDGAFAWLPYSAAQHQKKTALWPGRVRYLKPGRQDGRAIEGGWKFEWWGDMENPDPDYLSAPRLASLRQFDEAFGLAACMSQ